MGILDKFRDEKILEKINASGIYNGKKHLKSHVSNENPRNPVKISKIEFEVVCLDNVGLEDKFDIGMTYIAFGEKDGFITVYDRFGKPCLCMINRFNHTGE